MIVDGHVHLDLKRFKNIKKAARQLIDDMDRAHIDKAVLMPDNNMNMNEHIEAACRLFPDRFYGFGMINPKQSRKKIKIDIDILAGKKWLSGIKLHPRMQKFNLEEEGVYCIADKIGAIGLPLAIDCFPAFKFVELDEKSYPNAFDKLAKENPRTNIIIAHMGGHRMLDAFSVAISNTNIYLDVSYTFYYYKASSVERDLAFILRKIGRDRVIYGTDAPSIGIKEGLNMFVKFCDKHKIDKNAGKNIFGNNILKIMGFSYAGFKLSKKR